ncbi:MAG TPA: Eco57I restriction-modification methylase domain-containing protein [Spirochaetota bacterium]|nr:Eco57I restriction-modification methylase domain-containing protein [Spirochaetota bacterium]
MAIKKDVFSRYIKTFQFRELFNEMGWNNDRTSQPIVVDNDTFTLSGVAEKSGFKVLICQPVDENKIPDASLRKKIEGKVTKLFQEHLIIFIDSHKNEQVWQLAVRRAGSPVKISETRYNMSQSPELLHQRASGLFFTLDEEENVTIIDVTSRVAENFQQNNEKVTKKFYDNFKKEHTAFLKFIKGIADKMSMDWYASLMLNRLMFCYFIQKKGFLDNNKNYLQDKLKECKKKKGENKFYSFYRDFLLALFHKGLGSPDHDKKLEVAIGRIPYLNGGLFDEHEIEKTFKKIEIDDKAFEKLFNFFDEWEWHLDTREAASGRDINPDVIGYIFEKFINDRAQMGAYYTKEDITDYIAKNCIIPWLFDEVKRNYPKAFTDDGWLWTKVKESGDDYIYDSVKYGIPESGDLFADLPEEIQKGFKPELEKKVVDGKGPWLWELRKEWNKPAPTDIALPTEIYREVIERRKRYDEIKTKILNGEIKEINDFITYNLNIRQFAQDVVEDVGDPVFIRHFYNALSKITILDPTCGSGAFLFAALNILEPLYEACILRMQNFISESAKGKHKSFEDTLKLVNAPEHPNLQYFIYKSIILNNLYGVDIMKEAVEIAKLRLFLKLVGAVDADYSRSNLGLEPLPDVDFNIRAGNSLVGYATKNQVDNIAGMFVTNEHKKKILEQSDVVAKAFSRYKEIQLLNGDDFEGFKKAKDELNKRLMKLTDDLDNIIFHEQYQDIYQKKDYEKWRVSHQPFHWFAEFYEILNDNGGFDVIIGNPPYVVYNDSNFSYKIKNYLTYDCSDLYAYIIERSIVVSSYKSAIGMIVPISIISTDGFSSLRNIIRTNLSCNWFSSYSMRPGKLFDGVDKHLTIFLSNKLQSSALHTSKYHRWFSEERENLFPLIKYTLIDKKVFHNDSIPKIGRKIEYRIIEKIKTNKAISLQTVPSSKHKIYHTRKLRYFLQFLDTAPKIYEKNGKLRITSELKEISFKNESDKLVGLSCYLSSLFFWYYITYSDCRNLNKREVSSFPLSLDYISKTLYNKLNNLAIKLLDNLQNNSYFLEAFYKKYGQLKMQVFQPRLSKDICDSIDACLGVHYLFLHNELDIIVNYDIKYRIGKEIDGVEDED